MRRIRTNPARLLLPALMVLQVPMPLPGGEIESMIASATAQNRRNTEGDIVVLRDGTLLAAWSDFYGGDRDDSSARISASRSRNGGRTWGSRFTLQENIGKQNVMSVSLLRSRSGDILFFFGVKNSPSDLRFYVRRSRDEAISWSAPAVVNPEPGYYVMNNARVIQLTSGRLLAPMAFTEQVWTRREAFRTVVYYSDNDGVTWRRSPSLVEAPQRGAMEPGLVELADGRVLQIIRTQTGRIWHSYSSDRGETWTEAQPWTVAAPEAPSTLTRLPGGELLLIYNPVVRLDADHAGPRTPLVAALSRDEGVTWSQPKTLESDPAASFAYTSVTFDKDKALLTYWVGKGRMYSLKFRSLPLDWFGR
jgi:sialidase-1